MHLKQNKVESAVKWPPQVLGVHGPSIVSIAIGAAVLLLTVVFIAIRTPAAADALKGVAELVKAFAWPLVVFVFVILLRDQVGQQITRIRKLKVMELDVEFAEVIEKELKKTAADAQAQPIAQAGAATPAQAEQAGELGKIATDADLPALKQRVLNLAAEYKRVRGSMPSGDERTRAMSVVTAQMRALGQAAYVMRRDLAFSREAGERIACITMLQVQPDFDMVDWLASRVSNFEVPFVQYQALQALLAAARNGSLDDSKQMIAAYRKALAGYGQLDTDHRTDRSDLLNEIEKEVQWMHEES